MKVHVQKWGNSLAVRIPKAFADEAGLKSGVAVEMRVRDGEVVFKRRRYGLAELVSKITPKNRHGEVDWGKPRGGEVW